MQYHPVQEKGAISDDFGPLRWYVCKNVCFLLTCDFSHIFIYFLSIHPKAQFLTFEAASPPARPILFWPVAWGSL